MSLYPCRCKRCRARRTLAQPPEWYAKPPTCGCGGLYAVDTYRKSTEHKRTACRCDGYSWSITNGPHRRGSLRCNYYRGPATDGNYEGLTL